jgi:hypothetical protein
MDMPLWFGPYGSGVLPDNVRDYGVNATWFHGFSEERFEACAKLGIAACVELKTFRADFAKYVTSRGTLRPKMALNINNRHPSV